MFEIEGTTITLTKGDSFYSLVELFKEDGDAYEPEAGDVIRFALKKHYFDAEALVDRIIPNDTQILHLFPGDTSDLAPGKYVYDCEITFASGDVDTFINEADFILKPEVI